MRPASGPRTARAFIPATATYRLGRQQRSAPHDRHQGPSQHDGTTAVGVVGGTIAGAGGGFGKCGGRRVCTTGRRREHAATGFEESTDNRGDKKRRILDTCDTVFHLEKGGKIKKKGTARYPTQAAREEPAPSPPAPPPAEKDRVTRRIRYTQNSICRRRPLANPRARLYSTLTLRTFCSGVNNSDCPTGSGLLHLGSPVSVSSPAPATAGQPDTYTGLFPGRPATAATPP